MYFKLTMAEETGQMVWRTEAVDVEDGIRQFELAALSGEIATPAQLEEKGYKLIEIGWAPDGDSWD